LSVRVRATIISSEADHSRTNGRPANRAPGGSFGETSVSDGIVNAPKRRRRSRMSSAMRAAISRAARSHSGDAKWVIPYHPPPEGRKQKAEGRRGGGTSAFCL